jgi:hypothetical protein
LLSTLVQYTKNTLNLSPNQVRAAVIVLSVIGGATYNVFAGTPLWEEALKILLAANAMYLFLIKPFEA